MNLNSRRSNVASGPLGIVACLSLTLVATACGGDEDGGAVKTPTLASESGAAFRIITPTLSGVTSAGATVDLYLAASCAGTPVTLATADAAGAFSAELTVPSNTATTVSAKARLGGESSTCSASLTLTHDDIAPDAPTWDGDSPKSPGSTTTPALLGQAEAGSEVSVFEGSCDTEAVAQGPAADFNGGAGIPVTVAGQSVSTFFAVAVDAAGNRSDCSRGRVYEHDGTPPADPVFKELTSYGPSPDTEPGVRADVEPNTDLLIFGDDVCQGAELGRGDASELEGNGFITFKPILNDVTRVYIQSEDRAGNRSGCVDSVKSYIHDDTSPAPPLVECPPGGHAVMVTVSGDGPPMGQVALYATKDCSGDVAANASVDGSGEYSVEVEIPAAALNTQVYFSGIATGPDGGASSSCSAAATYVHDAEPPLAPYISYDEATPTSTLLTPVLRGLGEAGTLAEVFGADGCVGTALQNSVVSDEGEFAFIVQAAPNSHSVFSARLTDAAGNVSSCSQGATWTHDNEPPTLELSALEPTSGDSALLKSEVLTDNLALVTDMTVDICIGTSAGDCDPFVSDATLVPSVDGDLLIDEDGLLSPDTRYYVWARPRDAVGIEGAISGPVSARTPGANGTVQLALGAGHGCVVTTEGSVSCFGSDADGQLGMGGALPQTAPTAQIAGLENVVEVAVGGSHSCARTVTGDVYCWGDNAQGQTSASSGTTTDSPVQVGLPSPARGLALGENFSCALTHDGAVLCWGDGSAGQLGPGQPGGATPVTVGPPVGVRQITAGDAHACALTSLAQVWCWGDDAFGQLGNGASADPGPSQAALPLAAVSVVAGARHSCALLSDGSAYCWGDNAGRQLGDGTEVSSADAPQPVIGLDPVVALAAGDAHSCAIRGDGVMGCWGSNSYGQVGDGTTTPRPTWTAVAEAPAFVAATAAGDGTCAVTAAGQAHCWGHNVDGSLGLGTAPVVLNATPLDVWGVAQVEGVLAAGDLSGAVWTNGNLVVWGDGSNGKSGDGMPGGGDASAKLVNLDGDGVVKAAIGGIHACALHGDGAVSCWGGNSGGQVALPSSSALLPPTVVADLPPAKDLAVGAEHACIAAADGQVYCWGANNKGQLGGSSTQTPVSGVAGAVAVAAGDQFSCALTAAGTVYCWGTASVGELGFGGDDGAVYSPTLVPGVSVGQSLVAGASHVCVLQSSGAAVCWGGGSFGQLGSGQFAQNQTPEAVMATVPFVRLSAGTNHTCGVRADGDTMCWGFNAFGQLGDGTMSMSSEPKMGSVQSQGIAAGEAHTCALSEGRVWCVGSNSDKQLGTDAIAVFTQLFVAASAEP